MSTGKAVVVRTQVRLSAKGRLVRQTDDVVSVVVFQVKGSLCVIASSSLLLGVIVVLLFLLIDDELVLRRAKPARIIVCAVVRCGLVAEVAVAAVIPLSLVVVGLEGLLAFIGVLVWCLLREIGLILLVRVVVEASVQLILVDVLIVAAVGVVAEGVVSATLRWVLDRACIPLWVLFVGLVRRELLLLIKIRLLLIKIRLLHRVQLLHRVRLLDAVA